MSRSRRTTPPEPFTDLDLALPDRREGKVRISFALPDDTGTSGAGGAERRLLVTTDRLSAFDRVIAGVPYKGQVLNELSAWWFERMIELLARTGARHHLLDVPDPNVSVVRAATPLPVEVVVRGHITGVTGTSLWRRYADGQRMIDGHRLPDGLRKNEPLPTPIITPTTKTTATDGRGGHDEPISCAEVVERGLVDAERWEQVQATALAVFEFGVAVGAANGALLADTKYEFGIDRDGTLLLIDEVHTPDSSRWWLASTYEGRLAAGEEPESLDKEVVRRAFADLGYRGDGPVPDLPAETWEATSARYLAAFRRIVGRPLHPGAYPVPERIVDNLSEAGLL